MKHTDNEINENNALLDFDDEVTARIESAPEEAPVAPAAEPEPEPAPVIEEPTPEPAPAEKDPEPSYGAPQPLFEDIIPVGFARDERKRKETSARAEKEIALAAAKAEKEADAARKKAEKEAAKEAKKQAKADKKRAATAALIAKVEAEAEAKAKKEIEAETGEPYEAPAEAPVEEKAEEPVQIADASEAPAVEEAPAAVVAVVAEPEAKTEAPATPQKEEAPSKKEAAKPKRYSKLVRKLRKKYKMDRDPLLVENSAVPGFVIAKGETVIRSYDCFATGKGDGVLCLTNKRLLINAGERSEIDIHTVSGIKFGKFMRFFFLRFLLGLILLGAGVLMLLLPSFNSGMNIPGITGESWKESFTILFYACGGVAVILSLPFLFTMVRKTFYFYVYARVESPFLECKSRVFAKREKKGKVYKYMIGKAGRESEKAARELGALIIEAKEGRYDD